MKVLRYILGILLNRQFLVFLSFVLLAAIFWLFNVVEETQEREFEVPIVLTHVPANVIITTDVPKTLKIKLRDKGVQLLQYYYNKKYLPQLEIDYDDWQASEGHVNLLTANLLKGVREQLAPTTQVLGYHPDTLSFYFNYGEHRRLPVRMQGVLNPAAGYAITDVRFSIDSVEVYAPHHIFDTLAAAYTKPFVLNDVAEKMTGRVALMPIKGVKYETKNVSFTAITDRLVEKRVQVPVQCNNMPDGQQLRTFPGIVTVTFQVGMQQYRAITAEYFTAELDYEKIKDLKDNHCAVKVTCTAPGVSYVKASPKDVEFIVENK